MFIFAYTCLVCSNFHVLYICDTSPICSATFEAPWWALGWRLRIREPQRLARAPSRDPLGDPLRDPRNPSKSRSLVIFLGPSWVVRGGSPWKKHGGHIDDFQLFFLGWSQISRVLAVFWVVENDSVLWCRWSVQNFTFSSFLRRFDPDSGHVIQDGLAV